MDDATAWERANLEHLGHLFDRTALMARANTAEEPEAEQLREQSRAAEVAAVAVADTMDLPPAALTVGATFGLSDFELSTVLLCALWELDPGRLRGILSSATGPSFGAAMSTLDGAHWSAATPGAPLRHYRLLEQSPAESLIVAPLRIAEPLLHYLKGAAAIDPIVARYSSDAPPLQPIPDRLSEVVGRLVDQPTPPGLVQLTGEEWLTVAVGTSVATALGLPARILRVQELPSQPSEVRELRTLIARDTLLGTLAPVFVAGRSVAPEQVATLAQCLAPELPLALVAAPEPLRLELPNLRTVPLETPDHGERAAHWERRLGDRAALVAPLLDRIVAQFRLPPVAVDAACAAWLRAGDGTDGDCSDGAGSDGASSDGANSDGGRSDRANSDGTLTPEGLWRACLDVAAPALDGLAERLPPRDAFRELVLPNQQRETLESIVAQVRQRSTVDVHWKMQRRGGGIAVLFSGPSGTGKTLAAEGLAWELDLPLYRVDLSSVVSKYVGETEKHLAKLFDAAEASGAVLLFDEADALFGKRSEVASAHDRYANIEVSYLLQRLETYTGLAILTTNHRANIDQAFLRRVRFVVNFPTPGRRQRHTLWQRVFTPQVPTAELDCERLAEFELTGGSIRNAALVAASLAADASQPVDMDRVLRAVRLELAKDGKSTHSTES